MLWIWEQWLDTAEHQVQSKVVPYCSIENINFDFDSVTVKVVCQKVNLVNLVNLENFWDIAGFHIPGEIS